MSVHEEYDSMFKIYQPFFKNHTVGFEQQMVFAPAQMRFYHFYMPKSYLGKYEFTCIPDGCADMVFVYDEGDYKVEFIGSPLSKKVLTCYPGSRYFGVRLKPGMFFDLDDISLADVTNHEIIYASRDLNVGAFVERLQKQEFLSEKIDLFLSEFSASLTDTYLEGPVRGIIENINASKGCITVSKLAENLCYSERQVRRLLDANMNISPKTLCRIVRFQNALHRMIRNPDLGNTQYIADLDYADQAHFQREFKEFTGLPPQEFRRRYKRTLGRPQTAFHV
ncbi:MAG: helix-turn-helix domain-containing protein [Clostridiales Family XIII bacterium]|nr:helix-turn-helix domain-containing protein [Clostridiales Family XIII bacterium]